MRAKGLCSELRLGPKEHHPEAGVNEVCVLLMEEVMVQVGRWVWAPLGTAGNACSSPWGIIHVLRKVRSFPSAVFQESVPWDHGNIDPVTVVFVIALSVLVCASMSYTGFILWESGFVSWNIFGSFLCVMWSFC